MSQVAIPVRTEASGLVFLEPKHSVLVRHNVRTANGVAEVKGNRPFKIVVSNFSEQPRMLQKEMTIGYATRNPTGVYCLNDESSRTFETVLNLPFVRKDDSPRRVEERDVVSLPEPKPDDWQNSVDWSQVDDESLCGKILSMLSKHRDVDVGCTPVVGYSTTTDGLPTCGHVLARLWTTTVWLGRPRLFFGLVLVYCLTLFSYVYSCARW